ncbi:hypothetical protein WNY37_03635 [Henriciella sp. AS95]|uniref:hypothetical protein n=1 Tax=Henriciella sp. AS95 TaxID=3135782 RepID=UPI0031820A52
MKRLIATLAATTAFAAAPALADNHMEKGDMSDHEMDADMKAEAWTSADESALTAQKATQVFLAIDTQNDGLITEGEWARWQNRGEENLMQFAEYDTDSDGDIELSEYLETYKQ